MNPFLRFAFVCLTSATLAASAAAGQELQSQPEKKAVPDATAPAPEPALQQPQPQPEKKTLPEFQVGADKLWVDTGLDLKRGDRIQLTSSGKIKFADGKESGPEGLPRGWSDLIRILPLANSNRGTTIAKIGSSEAAHPFLIGPSRETRIMAPGRLGSSASIEPATTWWKAASASPLKSRPQSLQPRRRMRNTRRLHRSSSTAYLPGFPTLPGIWATASISSSSGPSKASKIL